MTAKVALRRAVLFLARVNVGFAWLFSLAVVHLPGPSSFAEPDTQESVRGAWRSAGDLADRAASPFSERMPEPLVRLFDLVADDKTIHFMVFFVLAGLLAIERWLARREDGRSLAILTAVLIAQSALGELIQNLGGRVGELGDFVANVVGIFSAFLLVLGARAVIRAARGGRPRSVASLDSSSSGSSSIASSSSGSSSIGSSSIDRAGSAELDPLADHSDRVG